MFDLLPESLQLISQCVADPLVAQRSRDGINAANATDPDDGIEPDSWIENLRQQCVILKLEVNRQNEALIACRRNLASVRSQAVAALDANPALWIEAGGPGGRCSSQPSETSVTVDEICQSSGRKRRTTVPARPSSASTLASSFREITSFLFYDKADDGIWSGQRAGRQASRAVDGFPSGCGRVSDGSCGRFQVTSGGDESQVYGADVSSTSRNDSVEGGSELGFCWLPMMSSITSEASRQRKFLRTTLSLIEGHWSFIERLSGASNSLQVAEAQAVQQFLGSYAESLGELTSVYSVENPNWPPVITELVKTLACFVALTKVSSQLESAGDDPRPSWNSSRRTCQNPVSGSTDISFPGVLPTKLRSIGRSELTRCLHDEEEFMKQQLLQLVDISICHVCQSDVSAFYWTCCQSPICGKCIFRCAMLKARTTNCWACGGTALKKRWRCCNFAKVLGQVGLTRAGFQGAALPGKIPNRSYHLPLSLWKRQTIRAAFSLDESEASMARAMEKVFQAGRKDGEVVASVLNRVFEPSH